MDSRDKQLADLKDENFKLKNLIPNKQNQIDALVKRVNNYENDFANVEETNKALRSANTLVVNLKSQVSTLTDQVETLTSENQSLKSLNLKLQGI